MKRSRKYLFLHLIILTSCLWSFFSFGDSPNPLKVLTLNFNAETPNKTLKTKRLAIIEEYIKAQDLDVLFIQECWDYGKFKTMGIKVAQDLDMDVAYGFEDGVAGIRVTSLVILTKKNLKLRNIKRYKLPHSALTFGNGQTSWVGLGEVDMLVGGEITLQNGQDAFLWTSHMNNSSSEKRLDQSKFALAKIRDLAIFEGVEWSKALVILGGDFNAVPESPEQEYFRTAGGFTDTWDLAHPGDPGHTLPGEVTDPEYNPMIHGAGLFPPQYAYQKSERIDYLYVHGPKKITAQTTRVFTAPIQHVWMSDHFGISGAFDFNAEAPATSSSPSADSNFENPTKIFELTSDTIEKLPKSTDFITTPDGGFTLVNESDADSQIYFLNNKKAVYTAYHAGITRGETVSFAFFTGGDYHYRIEIRNYRKQPLDLPRSFQMTGTIHVR